MGAYGNDDAGSSSGSTYIFKRDGTSWNQQAKLLASDGAASDYFGWSVSVSGEDVIVGARYDDDSGSMSGSAYIFRVCPIADLDGDCFVNFIDFALLAEDWLEGTSP